MGAMARSQEPSVQVQPDESHQENLKPGPSSQEVIDEEALQKALNAIAAGEEDESEKAFSSIEEEVQEVIEKESSSVSDEEELEFPRMEEALPVEVLTDIIKRIEDARDLANCMATSKALSEAVKQVTTVHLVCQKHYYNLARERFPTRPPCSDHHESEHEEEEGEPEGGAEEPEEGAEEPEEGAQEPEEGGEEPETESESESEGEDEVCCAAASSSEDAERYYTPPERPCTSSETPPAPAPLIRHVSFKSACLNMLTHIDDVECLRIEVDQEMQANQLIKEEIHMVDFWLSEPMFVRRWTSACGHSLQHLALVDYGQQAIMRQSPILRILSANCRNLQTLELRNMFLDTSDIPAFPSLTALTLRCIKMTDYSLTDINAATPSLLTLALISVFGIQEAAFTSASLTVLCLGLSTPAKIIHLNLPRVAKLQLKMTAPDSLKIRAPRLAYVAVCMESRDGATVEFEDVTALRELLFGASQFFTLSHLLRCNRHLHKLFLDLPCMALADDGRYEGLVPHVPLRIPDMALLQRRCPALHTLSVGPGLWHALLAEDRAALRTWPPLSRLIVHCVLIDLRPSVALVDFLLHRVPSLALVDFAVHADSPVDGRDFADACQSFGGKVSVSAWKRSLNFACFSF